MLDPTLGLEVYIEMVRTRFLMFELLMVTQTSMLIISLLYSIFHVSLTLKSVTET